MRLSGLCLLLAIVLLLNGCSGCRKTPTEPSSPEPLKTEEVTNVDPTPPPLPEVPKPEPVKQEAPKPEPPKVETPKPKPPKVEPPKAAIPLETKSTEPPTDKVDTTSPVNTTSPVDTKSPVKTDSPVRQDSPVGIRSTISTYGMLTAAAMMLVAEDASVKTQAEASTDAEKRLRFNFRYAPWKDVIEWFAEQAELSLQADNVPSGSLNLTDNRYYTPTEALDVLNSYLLFKEYTILRKGKSMFVIFLPDGIPPNLLEPITPDQLDDRGKYELCRCVYTLNRTTPDVVQAEAEKLLGPQGSIVALPKSQQIIVTETGGTLRAIRDIIKRIDDPDAVSSGAIHLIEMKNLSADEALDIMRKLLAIEESDTSLRTAVDISGSKIWLSGRGDMIERAKDIIKTIDDSFGSKDVLLEGSPQFEVYNTGIADPATVLAVLQTMLAGTPDVRLSLDAKTGGIAALGRPTNHATIRETIRQMQLNVPMVDVIPLKRLSPMTAVENIKKFIATTTISSGTTSGSSSTATTTGAVPPTVEADLSARQVIVRGTVSQIAEIRALLAKLGEDGTGGRVAGSEKVRSIPLSPAAAALVLEQLKEVWPKLGENEIKVTTPGATVPFRSTNDLLPKREEPKPKDADVDELIDRTFDAEPPMTRRLTSPGLGVSRGFYLPVRYSEETETHQPVYQPIRATETVNTEIDELKRQNAELMKKLEQLETAVGGSTKEDAGVPAKGAPIAVSVGPGGLMLSSDDPEALDKLEELIRMLSDETVLGKTSLVVYYLKNSTAEVVAQTLQKLMDSSSGTALGVSGAGSVDTSSHFESEQWAAAQGLLSLGNSIEKTGPVSISADSRLNALLVQANPVDHKTIELLLPILDQVDPPDGSASIRPRPWLIPLHNIRAEEALEVVEKVYANRIQGGSGNTQNAAAGSNRNTRNTNQRQQGGQQAMPMMPGGPGMMPGMPGGPGMMIQQMMARMGGGGQSSATLKEQEATMTLGVDSRSNSLIVYAPESLYRDVEIFVREIDALALQTETVMETVVLKNISPDLAKQTIANIAGDSVKFTTSTSTSTTNRGGSFGTGTNRFGSGGFGGFGGTQRTGGFGNFGGGTTNPFLNIMRGGGAGGFGAAGGGAQRPGGFGGAGQRVGGFGGR